MTHSMFITLYPKRREHSEKFFNYFRISVTSFDDLLNMIQEDVSMSKLCSTGYSFCRRKTSDYLKTCDTLHQTMILNYAIYTTTTWYRETLIDS
nr:unnamed protein product [Callosobruchus chinensis]